MPLIESILKLEIQKALEDGMKIKNSEAGSPPLMHSQVAAALAKAYDSYAAKALAGPLLPTTPGDSMLKTPFAAPNFAGVGPALLPYWLATTWAGPGFTPGITIPAAIAGVTPEIAAMAGTNADSIDAFATKLAGILHKYTGMLTVIATTTTPPPTPTTFPVS